MLIQALKEARLQEQGLRGITFQNEVLEGAEAEKLDFEQVRFVGCWLLNCDFSKAAFYDTVFEGCDLSGSRFEDSYWKNSRLSGCKAEGGRFAGAVFLGSRWEDCRLSWANFSESRWEKSRLKDCVLQESFLSRLQMKKMGEKDGPGRVRSFRGRTVRNLSGRAGPEKLRGTGDPGVGKLRRIAGRKDGYVPSS